MSNKTKDFFDTYGLIAVFIIVLAVNITLNVSRINNGEPITLFSYLIALFTALVSGAGIAISSINAYLVTKNAKIIEFNNIVSNSVENNAEKNNNVDSMVVESKEYDE